MTLAFIPVLIDFLFWLKWWEYTLILINYFKVLHVGKALRKGMIPGTQNRKWQSTLFLSGPHIYILTCILPIFSMVEFCWANDTSSLGEKPCLKALSATKVLVQFSWTVRSKMVVVSEWWQKCVVESMKPTPEKVIDIFSHLQNLRKKTSCVLTDIRGLVVRWVLSQTFQFTVSAFWCGTSLPSTCFM